MAYTVSMFDAANNGARVMKMQSIYERMRTQWNTFRSQALKAYEYTIGNQIDDDIREQLRKENRPAMVFNLMQPKIVTIAGLLESNKMYLRAIPVSDGEEEDADMHTRLVSDFALRNCNGLREITKAAIDAAIGGIGWTNNYWSTKEDIQGMWYTESYDPFMVLFDVDARRQDQRDWRYMCITGFYTADEIISIFSDRLDDDTIAALQEADQRVSGLNATTGKSIPTSWIERVFSGVQDYFSRATVTKKTTNYEGGTINDFVDSRMGRYRVLEFHDKRTKIRNVFYNAMTRETKELDGGDNVTGPNMEDEMAAQQLDTLNQASGGGWMKKTYITQELWVTACAPWLLADRILFEQRYPVQGRGFQFKPIFCYDFHPDITKTQSLIQILLDPQDSYNQRRMTFLEWLMDAVNPDVYAPKNSIEGEDIAVWQSKVRGKLKFFQPVGGMAPERQHPLAEGQALKTFSDEDRDLAETLTNITPNTQGQEESGSNESGVLFAQKVQRALTALSYFFGNVQFSMKEIFRYCDGNLQVFMDTPRKVRLLDDKGNPSWVQLNQQTLNGVINDVTEGEFDFEADTIQLGETAKQVKFAEAMNFVKSIPPQLVKWDELFQLWDSPVAKVMGEFAAQMLQITMQGQMQQQQAQSAMMQQQLMQSGAQTTSALEGVHQAGVAADQQRAAASMQGPGGGPQMAGRATIPQGTA